MSSAIAHSSAHSSKSLALHFLLRRLHSLSGIVFGLYIVVHLIVNATMVQGGNVFQSQVDKIHGLPFLLVVEWIFIFLPIIFHAVYGIWITFAGQINVQNYPYEKNVYYTLQRISAMILIGFLVFHVMGMKGFFGSALEFGPLEATRTTVRHINANWLVAWVIYPIGILSATFHLANGFWTAAITWGLAVSKAGQRRWGLVCAGIFLLTFVCGMVAWGTAVSLKGKM